MIRELEHRLHAKWRWWLLGEGVRKTVRELLAQDDAEKRELRDKLHLAQVELDETKRRLRDEQAAHAKAQENIGRLWNFIATRNKPITAQGIKAVLDNLNKPKK